MKRQRTAEEKKTAIDETLRLIREGHSFNGASYRVGSDMASVRRWMRRFNSEGLAGLADRRKGRSGRPRKALDKAREA